MTLCGSGNYKNHYFYTMAYMKGNAHVLLPIDDVYLSKLVLRSVHLPTKNSKHQHKDVSVIIYPYLSFQLAPVFCTSL